MFSEVNLSKLLFFDIETAGEYPTYEEFKRKDPDGAKIFATKAERLGYTDLEESYYNKVSLFPEFAKVVCLSYGVWKNGEMKVSTISETDEKDTMKKIANLFYKAGSQGLIPCGWNIKNFDVPWIFRKMLMHKIQVPNILNTYGKKPWEINIVDLKEMWKSFSNLDVTFEEAVYSLKLPSPKDVMDGSKVHYHYWNNVNLEGIKYYCEKDVTAMIHMCEYIKNIYYENDITVNKL